MGRTAKPWWWEERNGYYAFVNGSRRRLGTSQTAAKSKLKELLSQPKQKVIDADSVAMVLDDFLTWTQENRAQKTYTRYRDFIQCFVSSCGVEGGQKT